MDDLVLDPRTGLPVPELERFVPPSVAEYLRLSRLYGDDAPRMMADSKISALSAITTLAGTEEFVVAASGSSNKITAANMQKAVGGRVLICSQVLSGSQATFDTNTILGGNISGSYTHLQVMVMGAITAATTNDVIKLTFNNDTTAAHYQWAQGQMSGSGSASGSGGSDSSIPVSQFPGTTATPANTSGMAEILVANYAGTTFNKNLTARTGLIRGTTAANNFLINYYGQWISTAAITRITLTPNSGSFATGSAFYLYGLY